MITSSLIAALAATTNVLVFTKTVGFRHDSIPTARSAMLDLAAQKNWTIEFSEDSNVFSEDRLKNYDVVVFLLTTGDILNSEQEMAFRKFVESGGGFVGVHSASDTEYDWEWYGKLVGAYFKSHPAVQEAVIRIETAEHPTTSFLPSSWTRTDEWYCFKHNPRSSVNVLATVDESTYSGGTMGADHPIMWWHDSLGGRAWYTAMGHTKESYTDPMFMRTIAEAVEWVKRKR
jgi:type 1 glutamine amidotransferase